MHAVFSWPIFWFLFCHLLIPSPGFSKPLLSCELSYVSTGDRNAFQCPIPRSLVIMSSCKKCCSVHLVPSSFLLRTVTHSQVDTGVGFGLCHCWHFTGHLCCSSAPAQLRSSPSLQPEPWLFSHAHSHEHLPVAAAGTDLMQLCTHQRHSSRLEAFWLLGCFCQ